MRKFKKFASMALAAVMTLAMCAPAFAVEGSEEKTGPEYNVWQVFTGTYAETDGGDTNITDKILGNIHWGQNSTGYVADQAEQAAVGAEVLDVLADKGDNTTDAIDAVKAYVDFESTPIASGRPPFDNLADGYYLVSRKGTLGDGEAATAYVIKAIGGQLNFAEKSGVPTVDKKVNSEHTTAASIGDTLNFEITGTLPENLEYYKSYFYTFEDTMSKGLAYNDDAKVYLVRGEGETELVDQFYVGSEPSADGESTILTIGTQNLKAVVADLVSTDKIVVRYSATLTEDAKVGMDPNTNDVILHYPNDPNKTAAGVPNDPDNKPEPDPETDGKTVTGEEPKTAIYVTGLTVTDFANGKPMKGAEFTLSGQGINKKLTVATEFVEDVDGLYYKLKNGTYTTQAPEETTKDQYEGSEEAGYPRYKVQLTAITENTGEEVHKVHATINENGALTITGLSTGSYTLHQDSAPAGYNVHDDITFEVTFADKTFGKTAESSDLVIVSNNWFYINLNQGVGTLLPETGGIGTTLLYIAGILLLAGAGATFILKGKKEEDAV